MRIFQEDRELGATLEAAADESPWHLVKADVMRLRRGPWLPGSAPIDAGSALGLLVLDGLLIRSVEVVGHRAAELLGPGDLLRPWELDGDAYATVPTESRWQVVVPARVALLDQRYAALAGACSELTAALMNRVLRRSRLLAALLAVAGARQLKVRVMTALLLLSDRWGRVTPEGVALPLPITHETLAQLVGASRPSVTTAIAALRSEGLVQRTDDHGWLLNPQGSTSPRRIA